MEKQFTVQTKGLCKEYDGRAVLNRMNINVAVGEIYGILGANGAGKTTLLKPLIHPDTGAVTRAIE